MGKILIISLFSGALLSLSACSWVQPLPGAFHVAYLPASEVTDCKKLGSTHASVLDKVWFYNRDSEAVKQDLIAVARNTAVDMRGDTIVATSALQNGRMDFDIYRCLNQ
ncbi:hypothetical protein JCM30760_12550 [Thiomicrorhabdus hydrogeniphila]